ncbi:MAG: glycosyltransferase family 2 protein [Vicinamibacterales bacterium]
MTPEALALVSTADAVPCAATAPIGLSICIPVYNEEGAVAETLERCLAVAGDLRRIGVHPLEVIAVDDGSRDASAETIARYPEVRLIRHDVNRGYGAALKTGFAAASHELVGFLDADATYPPEHFANLCSTLLRSDAALVIGSRLAGAQTEMPAIRRLGNTFFAGLLTLIGRTSVTDSASGMRVFRRGVLDVLSPLPDGLNLTPVMSTRAVHERIKVVEVPIPYKERVGESKLSVTKDGMRFLATMVSTALAYNPVRIFGAAGLFGVAIALTVLAGLAVARLQGVTTLGPWGTLAVFVALVSGVSGVSVFALGATFNYLVSLFYDRPIRQGLFKRPLLRRPVEDLFLPAGVGFGLVGVGVSVASLVFALRGWPVERYWLYLTGGAMAILVGLQLVMWWLMASVLRELSQRRLDTGRGH